MGFTTGSAMEEAQQHQQAAALREKEMRDMYHRITRVCFNECVTSFALTKQFLPGEVHCLETCALKYYQLSMSMGGTFADMYMQDQQARR
ncbi:hypothetical protein T492DRAFT_930718 [Pavlovales sp. CCMP2436]|nr:hypothetical protein T492DRAFT_930718 [Pavlovales sp. CCMP2436]|mmetsp:Transcript_34599/g.86211  ORF Transcript_34599/g.86211 Transcript_34599/m.86211 type:complete len:90 (-) Transcript_34599:344-613(-)